tara:strand:+ start:1092 stop:1928 length:837 start_codon:yes stop_codon:yes gene_type:complete
MSVKVGLVRVPVETVYVKTDNDFIVDIIPAYFSGITNTVRDYLKEIEDDIGYEVRLVDLGELDFGLEENSLPYKRNVDIWGRESLKEVTLDMLFEERERLFARKEEFDLLVCLGLSHFGGLLLYEDNERVARLDCHGDYFEEHKVRFKGANYASYMNTVERRFPNAKIVNYGVKTGLGDERMSFLGEDGFMGDDEHLTANHFDIDVDCFSEDLRISRLYHCSDLQPYGVERMISQAKPKKIGIWEYRPEHDMRGYGFQFIVNSIRAAAGDREGVQEAV